MTKDNTSESSADKTEAKAAGAAPKEPAARAKATKADKILRLLKRSKGATIAELTKATGWQAHSVRGFLSGTVKKRIGLDVLSEKDDKGIRRYRVAE